ncbi:hypothetical protein [Ornithinimicrobium avium]|uniref:Uncharacterized protein n=1 Tax=Ornithinimicrobium avium TaxID=2283195 RepID=A0A345NIM5_9MICO|nr:hypothetical protein [Ornithinimicrobium avium]AXH94883.1 hypothetical protein DV701_00630 [Ornithinimicrobium avium]
MKLPARTAASIVRGLILILVIGGIWIAPLAVSRFPDPGDVLGATVLLGLAAAAVLSWGVASSRLSQAGRVMYVIVSGLTIFIGLFIAVPLTGWWQLPIGSTGFIIFAFPAWSCMVLFFAMAMEARSARRARRSSEKIAS